MESKENDILIRVELDENKIPEQINWQAAGSGMQGFQEAKAMFLSFWDGKDKSTLRIDLWTKEMPVDDMKKFFYENMMSIADTYIRATNDEDVAQEMRLFAQKFGVLSGILKK
jgi:gliding motility-associated protein GldC